MRWLNDVIQHYRPALRLPHMRILLLITKTIMKRNRKNGNVP